MTRSAAAAPRRSEFEHLAQRWLDETRYTSDLTRLFMHPAYQRIIGMGPAVLPLIFERLEKELELWFWALSAITGQDVAAGGNGDVEAQRAAWLQWARENQYLGAHGRQRSTG